MLKLFSARVCCIFSSRRRANTGLNHVVRVSNHKKKQKELGSAPLTHCGSPRQTKRPRQTSKMVCEIFRYRRTEVGVVDAAREALRFLLSSDRRLGGAQSPRQVPQAMPRGTAFTRRNRNEYLIFGEPVEEMTEDHATESACAARPDLSTEKTTDSTTTGVRRRNEHFLAAGSGRSGEVGPRSSGWSREGFIRHCRQARVARGPSHMRSLGPL